MVIKKTRLSPEMRVLPVRNEKGFCYSEDKEGKMNGGPEDVGYDNWLDGLA